MARGNYETLSSRATQKSDKIPLPMQSERGDKKPPPDDQPHYGKEKAKRGSL